MHTNPPIPLYYQVKHTILKNIENGIWKPGDSLPTERWLCENYKVSRVTVRKALDELLQDGAIIRSKGKSALVAQQKMERTNPRMTGLSEEFSGKGLPVENTVLWQKTIAANKKLSDKLKVPEGEPLWQIRRIRKVNGQPIVDQLIHLVLRHTIGLTPEKLTNQSLYQTMEREFHLELAYATQTIGAALPTREQMRFLEMKEESPVLTVELISYLKDDTPIEYTINHYVSDLYHITNTVYR